MSASYDTSDPGGTKSLLVEPIYQGQHIAGALAAFSDQLNSFTERDASNIRLLAGVLAEALSKAAGAGLEQSVALEPAAMQQLIERIIPTLRRMLESNEDARYSAYHFPQRAPQDKLPVAGRDTKPLQELREPREESPAGEAASGPRTEQEQGQSAQPVVSPTSPALEGTNVPRIEVQVPFEAVETSTNWPVVRPPDRAVHAPLAMEAAYGGLQRIKASISSAARSARNCLQAATAYRPNLRTVRLKVRLPALPKMGSLRDLCYAQYSFPLALKSANSLRGLRRAAPVVAILVLTVTFRMLKMGLHNPAQTTASSSLTTERQDTALLSGAKSDDRKAQVVERSETPAPLQESHMHVTDRATEDAVRTLSRYELAGLRRRADYGDDSAAFQMGMAYEIGHGLPQSCTTAAQWVARAAREGNAAAQYNLGLRYRDGDGVPVNEDETLKWLQKAAAQQSSAAQVALSVLTANPVRVIPRTQTSH